MPVLRGVRRFKPGDVGPRLRDPNLSQDYRLRALIAIVRIEAEARLDERGERRVAEVEDIATRHVEQLLYVTRSLTVTVGRWSSGLCSARLGPQCSAGAPPITGLSGGCYRVASTINLRLVSCCDVSRPSRFPGGTLERGGVRFSGPVGDRDAQVFKHQHRHRDDLSRVDLHVA